MQGERSRGDADRAGRLARGLGLVPLACVLVPALAHAQVFAPGGLATTAPPTMAAPAAGGQGAAPQRGGPGNLLPGLFDQFALNADLSERYSSNAAGAPGGESDYDTRLALGMSGTSTTAHSTLSFNYGFNADYFAHESQNVIISNYLNANAMAELVPEHVFLQAQAFANPVYINRAGNTGPAGVALPPGANGDLQNFYGYVIQPDFAFHLGDFLHSDLLPSYNAEYFVQQNGSAVSPLGGSLPNNLSTLGITERLNSGDYFTRMQWGVIASYSQMNPSAGGLTQRSATGELSYAIDHGVSVVVDGGYQTVKADYALRDVLNGPIIMGGMQFDLAKLTGKVLVGEQYHSFSGVGNLNYQLTPRLSLQAAAQDNVNAPGANLVTPGALISGLLQGIASGQIQLPPSGVMDLNGLINLVGLENSIARFRTQTLSLLYNYGETSVTAAAFNTTQDTENPLPAGQNYNMRTTGVYANIGHQFSQDVSGGLNILYHDDRLEVGGASGMEYDASLNYRLNDTSSLYLVGDYYQRSSSQELTSVSASSGSVSAISILVGINHSF
ncbi:MAG TPA: hypothetical protein VHV26_12055 [Rhizomicrobium sp.]|jgi:hypothetical protein|nr:hypothetical protein [Rhizomicrobium sp.]